MADITFEDVLKFAEQLTKEEQNKLIVHLQALRTKHKADPFKHERTVNSLPELYNIVFNKGHRFFANNHDLLLFRGQANSTWGLVPSVFRRYVLPPNNRIEVQNRSVVDVDAFFRIGRLNGLEKKIYDEFFERIRAYPLLRVDLRNPWEMLCLAQHYGVPTRLLDWTSNLNVATYICVAETQQDENDGAVWCLNASEIAFHKTSVSEINSSNGMFYDREEFVSRIDDLPLVTSFFQRLKGSSISTETTAYKFHVLRAPAIEDRIRNQNSFFTVDVTSRGMVDTEDDALTEYDQIEHCRDFLLKIVIPAKAKKRIKEDLERLGIDYSAVFPDLFGLGKYFQDLHDAFVPYWGKQNAANGD